MSTGTLDTAPGWKAVRLGDVVDILDSRRIPVNAEERAKRLGPIPYYGATGQVGWIDDFLFDEELILLGEDGAPFLDPAKPKAYLISGKSWVNNHAHVLRGTDVISSRFLLHQLNHLRYDDFVSGTTRLKLPQSAMKRIPLVVPPRDQQDGIVAEIEKQFARIAAASVSFDAAQRRSERYRASVLNASLAGQLVPLEAMIAHERGVEYEAGAELIARIAHDIKPVASSESLPEGWSITTIGDIAKVSTGATPYRGNATFWEGGSVPWVTSGLLNHAFVTAADEFITDVAVSQTRAKIAPAGSLLLALYGEGKTRGKVSELLIDAATNQACAVITLTPDTVVLKPFVKLFLTKHYEDLRRQSSGGVQPNLSLGVVKRIKVPVPPLAEQCRIVAKADRHFSLIDALSKSMTIGRVRSDRLRHSLLSAAFQGHLTPNALVTV